MYGMLYEESRISVDQKLHTKSVAYIKLQQQPFAFLKRVMILANSASVWSSFSQW